MNLQKENARGVDGSTHAGARVDDDVGVNYRMEPSSSYDDQSGRSYGVA